MEIQLTVPPSSSSITNDKEEDSTTTIVEQEPKDTPTQKKTMELPGGHPAIDKEEMKGMCPFLAMKLGKQEEEKEEEQKEEQKQEEQKCPYQHVWDIKEPKNVKDQKDAKPQDLFDAHMALSYVTMQWAKQVIKDPTIQKIAPNINENEKESEYSVLQIERVVDVYTLRVLYNKAVFFLQQALKNEKDAWLHKGCLEKSFESIIACFEPWEKAPVVPSNFKGILAPRTTKKNENAKTILSNQKDESSFYLFLGSLVGIITNYYIFDNAKEFIEFTLDLLSSMNSIDALQIKLNLALRGASLGLMDTTILETLKNKFKSQMQTIDDRLYYCRRVIEIVDLHLVGELSSTEKEYCLKQYQDAEACIRQVEQDLLFDQQRSPQAKHQIMMQLQTFRNTISETINAFRQT